MDKLKNKTASVKKFVSDHRVGIAVTTTSTLWVALMIHVADQHNTFLKEHDLFETYYHLDEE